jgi:hypothetical protein
MYMTSIEVDSGLHELQLKRGLLEQLLGYQLGRHQLHRGELGPREGPPALVLDCGLLQLQGEAGLPDVHFLLVVDHDDLACLVVLDLGVEPAEGGGPAHQLFGHCAHQLGHLCEVGVAGIVFGAH